MAITDASTRTRQPQAEPLVIGVSFNPSEISAALVNSQGRALVERRTETPQRTTRAVASNINDLILALAIADERGDGVINAIGIASAGLVDPPTERVSLPGMKGWTRVALRQLIEDALETSGHDIRKPHHQNRARAQHGESPHPAIRIYPQAAAAAAGEAWTGAARGKEHVIYLALGEELEAGILAGKQVVAGASGLAGAAGWLAVTDQFNAEYSERGCLAFEATVTALTHRAVEQWDGSTHAMLSQLIKADAAQLDAATILRAARGGDALARRVVHQTCRWLGRGIANMISLLNPEAVVLGGTFGTALKPFLDDIREETKQWAAPEAARDCRIVTATLAENAMALGAGRLALNAG